MIPGSILCVLPSFSVRLRETLQLQSSPSLRLSPSLRELRPKNPQLQSSPPPKPPIPDKKINFFPSTLNHFHLFRILSPHPIISYAYILFSLIAAGPIRNA